MPDREIPALVEERNISGRGIFLVPASPAYRRLYLYVNVVRRPRVNFLSSKYNPDKSEYAKILWTRNGYVLREDTVNFDYQLLEWDKEPASFLAYYMVCAFKQIEGYLTYLAPFIPAPPLVIDPTDVLYAEPVDTIPDKITVVCRGSTALNMKLYALNYDVGCSEAAPSPKESPDPDPVETVAPDVGVGTSAPYEDPNDGGDTIPSPIDEPEAPTVNRCIRIRNKGIQSGDIVFENFVCGIDVETPPADPFNGQATVSIIVTDISGAVVLESIQASYASNPVEWDFVPNDSVRQPQYSFGNCTACNT